MIYNQDALCRFSSPPERVVDANYKNVPTSPPFDNTEIENCCKGLHMVQIATPVGIAVASQDHDYTTNEIDINANEGLAEVLNAGALYIDDPDGIIRRATAGYNDPSKSYMDIDFYTCR